MKKSAILLLIILLVGVSSSFGQGQALGQVETLLGRAERALEDDNLTSAKAFITAAQALLPVVARETTCPSLPQIESLLRQAAASDDPAFIKTLVGGAQALVEDCIENPGEPPPAPTEEATAEATEEAIFIPTEEAVIEATEEAIFIATEEAVIEATEEAIFTPTPSPTARLEATEEAVTEPTEEAIFIATEEAIFIVTEEAPDLSLSESFTEAGMLFAFDYPSGWEIATFAAPDSAVLSSPDGAAQIAFLSLDLGETIGEADLQLWAEGFASMAFGDDPIESSESLTVNEVTLGYLSNADGSTQLVTRKLSDTVLGLVIAYGTPTDVDDFKPLFLEIAASMRSAD